MSEAKTPLTAAVEEAFLKRWRQLSDIRAYHSHDYNLAVIVQTNCLGWAGFVANKADWKSIQAIAAPTINFSNRHGALDWAINVFMDDTEIGRIAAEKFRSLGFKRFAYIGIEGHGYSKDRKEGFLQALHSSEDNVLVFEWDEQHSDHPIKFTEHRKELVRSWLDQMPESTGIFCCKRLRGQNIHRIDQRHGW